MEIGQSVRKAGLRARRAGSWVAGRLTIRKDGRGLRLTGKTLSVVAMAVAAYYIFGGLLIQRIDSNSNFRPVAPAQQGQSVAVAMAAALIDREIDDYGWVANDPFFKPTAFLDNMPNYQLGVIASLANFSFELRDQLGRTRGSSQADPDLQEASGQLQYSGDKWLWDPSVSLMPTATSEQQYRKAATALRNYNDRLLAGTATYERRADNLLATLDRIALDLGSDSAVIEKHMDDKSGFFLHRQADNVFYGVKGKLYGYYMILKALEQDFGDVITERNLQKPFEQMIHSFELAVQLEPGVVMNGGADSQMIPCHLCSQGFYLLRARTQLREITNILLK